MLQMQDTSEFESKLHSWMLKFKERGAERGFLRSQHERLAWNLFVCCGLFGSYIICAIVVVGSAWSTSGGQFIEADEVRPAALARNLQLVGALVLCVACMFIARCRRVLQLLGPLGLEIAATTFALGTIFIITGTCPWYLARIYGLNPPDVMGPLASREDADYLLKLDCLMTVVHLNLPIRWIMLWPVEVASVLCYLGVVFGIGSPLTPFGVVRNIALTSVLSLLAALGRRAIEFHERKAFNGLAGEKTLRVMLEHELEKLAEERNDKSGRTTQATDSWCSVEGTLPETLRSPQPLAPTHHSCSLEEIREAVLLGSDALAFPRVECPQARATLQSALDLLSHVVAGGALVCVADSEAYREVFAERDRLGDDGGVAIARSCDEGYMTDQLRGIHISDARFAAALREFTAHSDDDRWPQDHPDPKRRGRPKDGAFLVSKSGYRVKCATKLLGLRPVWTWENVGTKHEAAMACAWAVRGSFVFVKSDSGSLHLIRRIVGSLHVYALRGLRQSQLQTGSGQLQTPSVSSPHSGMNKIADDVMPICDQ